MTEKGSRGPAHFLDSSISVVPGSRQAFLSPCWALLGEAGQMGSVPGVDDMSRPL